MGIPLVLLFICEETHELLVLPMVGLFGMLRDYSPTLRGEIDQGLSGEEDWLFHTGPAEVHTVIVVLDPVPPPPTLQNILDQYPVVLLGYPELKRLELLLALPNREVQVVTKENDL